MSRIMLFVAFVFIGCATLQQSEVATEAPELMKMAPLPPTNSPLPMGGLKLYVLMHVLPDGSVGEAKLIESSGYTEWDSLAILSIKEWRFHPARRGSAPVDIWIRQPVVVQPQEPTVWTLGELVVSSRSLADSMHVLLMNGADFDSLAGRFSEAPSREHAGYLGRVDAAVYPMYVRDALRKLRENHVTDPIRMGDTYVIFKKFKKEF